MWNTKYKDIGTTIIIFDISTKKQETFKLNTTIPRNAEGAMVADKLYVIGGNDPVKTTYEIDAIK